jgi:hypothetical protein
MKYELSMNCAKIGSIVESGKEDAFKANHATHRPLQCPTLIHPFKNSISSQQHSREIT